VNFQVVQIPAVGGKDEEGGDGGSARIGGTYVPESDVHQVGQRGRHLRNIIVCQTKGTPARAGTRCAQIKGSTSLWNNMIVDMKAASIGTGSQEFRWVRFRPGPRLDGARLTRPEGVRSVFALKKGSHLSDAFSNIHRRSNLGKVSGRDKSDTPGGPFRARHSVNPGSRMMCWTAASDNGTGTESLVKEGPHRRIAEETAAPRLFKIGSVGPFAEGNMIVKD
jgi:hypothetical protein